MHRLFTTRAAFWSICSGLSLILSLLKYLTLVMMFLGHYSLLPLFLSLVSPYHQCHIARLSSVTCLTQR
jgi:hypothetical protein